MDPHNLDALDFLGRVRARQHFESGHIDADSGRTIDTAIKVDNVSQEYEFLRLFGVTPIQLTRLPNRPIDVWQCGTSFKTTVEYYFDISSAHTWAYGSQHHDKMNQVDQLAE